MKMVPVTMPVAVLPSPAFAPIKASACVEAPIASGSRERHGTPLSGNATVTRSPPSARFSRKMFPP